MREREYLSPGQIAEELGVSRSRTYKNIRRKGAWNA
jgi:hypothetical protein